MLDYFILFRKFFLIFIELKYRFFYIIISILITSFFCYILKEQLIYLLIKYLLYNMSSHRFIFTKLTQILFTYIKFSFILAFFYNLPFLIIHCFYFLNSALYKHEWFYWFKIVFLSIFIYFVSIFLNYFFIFPKILDLFLNFEKNNYFFPLHFEAKIDDFISTAFLWFFNIIICFQIPIIMHIFLYYQLIDIKNILINRKYFYLFFIFLSAFLAPPEIITQFILFLFFSFIFELLLLFLLFIFY